MDMIFLDKTDLLTVMEAMYYYVRSSLHAVQCNLSSKFPQQVWCYTC